jgi:hypothetical protein
MLGRKLGLNLDPAAETAQELLPRQEMQVDRDADSAIVEAKHRPMSVPFDKPSLHDVIPVDLDNRDEHMLCHGQGIGKARST